ncbi:hypothetical protein ACFQZQ_10585 [Lysobacter koreensis]|uniref:PH domain-containing protein n=1 Tax=Lysobacter koreensis TaxID=266122 RepID=A0ABW2YNV3_9GAMM
MIALGMAVFFAVLGALTQYSLAYIAAGLMVLCAVSMLGTTTVGPHYIARCSPFSDRRIFWQEITHIELGAGCTWFVLHGNNKRLAFVAPKALGTQTQAGLPRCWKQ